MRHLHGADGAGARRRGAHGLRAPPSVDPRAGGPSPGGVAPPSRGHARALAQARRLDGPAHGPRAGARREDPRSDRRGQGHRPGGVRGRPQGTAGLGIRDAGQGDAPEALLPRPRSDLRAPGQPQALRPAREGAAGRGPRRGASAPPRRPPAGGRSPACASTALSRSSGPSPPWWRTLSSLLRSPAVPRSTACGRTCAGSSPMRGRRRPRASPCFSPRLIRSIYDRRVTRQLWGFDYAWEAYVPAQRASGASTRSRCWPGPSSWAMSTPRADRGRGRLVVVSRRVRGGHATAGAVGRLAAFLGLRSR